ncbi:GntR family transcriptional regulator [Achromobacter spanius]|uniref:GntR family transcriptional regulator n=1 Tax=Achromobacter spanius TaxID=217203 RepID=UPI00320976EB
MKSKNKNISNEARKPNLRERVYGIVRQRIQMGLIRLDDRLVDHDIAQEMHVSRMPVREALMQLKSEGLLEGTARGFVLRRFTLAEMNEIFEIRTLLEPAAAASASVHADPKGLSDMKSALEHAEAAHAAGDLDEFMRSNAQFRWVWLTMVPNRELAGTISRYIDHVQVVRLVTMGDQEVRSIILDGMRGLYEAFLSGDTELVRARMLGHARAAAACYYNAYQRMLEPRADAV